MGVLGMALIAAGLIVVGGGIGFWLGRLDRAVEEAKLEETRAELDDYRRQVTEHFGQTAGHFQALGQQYKALYEHLAQGSEKLCDTGALDRELLFPLLGGAALEQAGASGDGQAETLDGSATNSQSSDTPPEDTSAGDEALDAAAVESEAVESETDEPVDTEAVEIGADVSEEISADDSNESAERLKSDGESDGPADEDAVSATAADAADSAELPADNVVELVPRSDSDDPESGDGGKDNERTYH